MPLVEIQALPPPGIETTAVLRTLCRELAAELGEPLHAVWAVWRPLEQGAYAEGENAPAEQPRDTHPPLVRVIGFEGRPPDQIEAMLECVARVLAREVGLEEENVFAIYEEARSGRLFDGGGIVKRDR